MTNYIGDWLLDIVSISTDRNKEEFDSEQIEAIAHAIINLRGVINPLIVRKTGYNADGEEVYELLEGHLEYFAARRAMEIDPKLEMIRAFVIEPSQETAISKQVQLLRRSNIVPHTTVTKEKPVIDDDYLVSQITNSVVAKLQPLFTELQQRITGLANKLEQSQPVVDLQNKEQSLITAINTLPADELKYKLNYAGLQKTTLDSLIANKPYADKIDLCKRVKGIKEKTFQKILAGWHG